MTAQEFEERMRPYMDKYRMVKPQESWDCSGNGNLYSSVYLALLNELKGIQEYHGDWYRYLVYSCSQDVGLIMRTPRGDFGQNSHDDYLGIAVACIILNERVIPKKILFYGIKHLGFYNNTAKLNPASFLWRFPHVWVLMWCAAFPWLKWPLMPLIYAISRFQNLAAIGASATQLIWLYHAGCKGLGFKFSKYDRVTKLLPDAFESYYSFNHPHAEAARSIQ